MHIPRRLSIALHQAGRAAAWALVGIAIVVLIQACAAKKPVHRSKFDSPKYDLNKTHKREP